MINPVAPSIKRGIKDPPSVVVCDFVEYDPFAMTAPLPHISVASILQVTELAVTRAGIVAWKPDEPSVII